MDTNKQLEILRNKPIFWSRLGLGFMSVDSPNKLFSEDFSKYAKFHDDFCDADVPIHTCILPSGWIRDGVYDYTETDKILDALFKSGKVKCFFPRVKLNVPIDWCKNHPEDVLVYHNGPRTPNEVKALVGTLKHDILGYDSEIGYYAAGAGSDIRPNEGGVISLQSFSSKKWLEDAGDALKKLIRHIEDGPYADKFIGYQIAYGASGESMLWGREVRRFEETRFADYGINNQREFYKWYKEHIDENAVWEDGDFVPSPIEKSQYGDTIETQFRSYDKNEKAIAYDTFMTEVNVNALEHFGKIVKDESGKLAGAFYGYLIHVSRSAYTGFLGWERLLNSEYVDFFAAPKSYYRSGFGDCGGEMSPFYSINTKKLWIDECDIRTHHSVDSFGGKAGNMEQTRYMLWREFAKNSAHNSGCWWMDLGDGWYDDKEIMQEVAKISEVNKRIKSMPSNSVADVLYVVDEESFKYSDDRFNQLIIECNLRSLQHTGCAINVCLQSDLKNINLYEYKLIVFANAFCITDEELKGVQARTDAKIVFNYAPGICRETTSLKNCEALTGLNFTAESGKPAVITVTGMSDRYYVNTAIPADVSYFRNICEKSGCHTYSTENTFIYTDNRILGVFSDKPLDFELKLKEKAILKNELTGEVFQNISSIKLNSNRCFEVFTYCL